MFCQINPTKVDLKQPNNEANLLKDNITIYLRGFDV